MHEVDWFNTLLLTAGAKVPSDRQIDGMDMRDWGLLPAAIGSYQRTAVEANALGGMGSEAEGTYTSGSNSFRLKITDMAAMGALAGIGSAMGVQHSQQDANGYEKTGTVDGAIQNESWHSDSHSGKFGRVVAKRFMIEADGSAASIDELKAAVAQIDPGALVQATPSPGACANSPASA